MTCIVPFIILFSTVAVFGFDVKRSIRTKIIHKEYNLYPSRVNWTTASEKCTSKGMDLVSILSKHENDEVISAIKGAGQGRIGFWTSGNRLNTTDNQFYWSNGEKITFNDWENGKPDKRIIDGEEEKCIEIKGFNTFKWNDNFCSHKMYYICQTLHELTSFQ